MPSVAQARMQDDLPPGVPLTAMGAIPNNQAPPTPDATSPMMQNITRLLEAARARTASLFGIQQQPAASPTPTAPKAPTPQLSNVRNMESGLDSLQARSTQLATPAPSATPLAANPAMGGSQAFDYRAYLNEMGKRPMGGK